MFEVLALNFANLHPIKFTLDQVLLQSLNAWLLLEVLIVSGCSGGSSCFVLVVLLWGFTNLQVLLDLFFFCDSECLVQPLIVVRHLVPVDAVLPVEAVSALGGDLLDLGFFEVVFRVVDHMRDGNQTEQKESDEHPSLPVLVGLFGELVVVVLVLGRV